MAPDINPSNLLNFSKSRISVVKPTMAPRKRIEIRGICLSKRHLNFFQKESSAVCLFSAIDHVV
jgi:hypothetical protein